MVARTFLWLGLTCLLWTASHVVHAAEPRLGGGMRFYGGMRVARPLRLPDGAASQTLRWRLASNRTTLAQGVVTVKREHPWLELDLPPVERHVDARLALVPEEGDGSVETIELYSPRVMLERLRRVEPVGWVGEAPTLTVAGQPVELPAQVLLDAGAVGAFAGAVLIVPPTTRVDAPLLEALLRRAEDGASVLAVGVDHAPWSAPRSGAAPTIDGKGFLSGIRPNAFDAWGRGGRPGRSRYAPPRAITRISCREPCGSTTRGGVA